MIDVLRVRLAQWSVWTGQSVNRRIFSGLLTIGVITALVRLATAGKDLVVAGQFGTSDVLDAFLIALVLPTFAVQVLAASFNPALVPTYISVRELEGENAAERLFSSASCAGIGLLVGVSLLLALAAPWLLAIVGSGFGREKLALTHVLFLLLLPLLTISGIGTIWASVLNATERFALVAAAPAFTPIMAVASLLLADKNVAIYALAIATVAGAILEAGLLAWALHRRGLPLCPRWYGVDANLRRVVQQYVPMVAGAALMSSTNLVDQSMATLLGPGSVSALSYGNKLVAFLLAVGATALGTAALPHLSRMVAYKDWAGLQHTLKTYNRLIALATIPLAGLLWLLAEPIVHLLFQRGAFTVADAQLVASVQAVYALQIPLYMLSVLLVRLISSTQSNVILLFSAAISLPLDIVLNLVLMRYLGVAGIALSTVLVYAVAFGFLTIAWNRIVKGYLGESC